MVEILAVDKCDVVLFRDEERLDVELFADDPVKMLLFGFGNRNTINPLRLIVSCVIRKIKQKVYLPSQGH